MTRFQWYDVPAIACEAVEQPAPKIITLVGLLNN